MSFTQKYTITPRYLTPNTKRRSGLPISRVKFVVAHDTGNPGSTAAGNVSYYEQSRNQMSASAHLFVDDKEIVECIPALTGDRPEKAWHVLYNLPKDNNMYGVDANDGAIAVEYCYGGAINADEAYRRYVWVLAYLCYVFTLDPKTSIVGHYILDPDRRSDPKSGLAHSGRTYEQLLRDVVAEYAACTQQSNPSQPPIPSLMKLIKNRTSNKVYAIGNDRKKYWIFNEETFTVGRQMGLWGDYGDIQIEDDDPYAMGHTMLLVR
ncbi:MAG TPA: peptidoglycan recognition family protein [Candidatus Kapabacteria bacterium]|nr:peptidoglycan recognition family protein [Candidatus Kapabacteria bacterium]